MPIKLKLNYAHIQIINKIKNISIFSFLISGIIKNSLSNKYLIPNKNKSNYIGTI